MIGALFFSQRRAIARPTLDAPPPHNILSPFPQPFTSEFLTFPFRYVSFDGRWQQQLGACPLSRSGTSATRAPTLSAAAPRTEQPPGSTPRMLPSAASAARAALPQAAGRGYGPQRQAPRTRTPWGTPSPSPWCVMFVVCFADERMLPLVSVDCRVFSERRGVTLPPPCAMDQPHEFSVLACA